MDRRVRSASLRASLPSRLPPGLEPLVGLALDLRWTWCHRCDALWRAIDADAWDRTQNPWLILQEVSGARLEALARDPAFVESLQRIDDEWRQTRQSTWMQQAHPGAPLGTVGYFSLEFAFGEALPLYAGGLGVLAADHLKAASDLGVPVVGVGLLYQEGYFRQSVDSAGAQRETYPYNDPMSLPIEPLLDADGGWAHVQLALPGRRLALRIWRVTAGSSTLLLLDSNDPLNAPADRGITGKLYGGGPEIRLLQELVLGVGGWRALAAAGVAPDVCHLNEGHAAFAAVERARSFAVAQQISFERALWATRAGNVFTTHTPVAAGFDRFPPAMVRRYFPALELDGLGVAPEFLLAMGRSGPDRAEPFNLAYLALRTCGRANAVSRLHGEVSRQLFRDLYPRWPTAEVPITHVTNGVHVPTWDSAAADRLWTDRCGRGRWLGDQGSLETSLDGVPDEELWAFRTESRHELIRYARARLAEQLGQQGAAASAVARAADVLDPNALTLGFARRFATYKRANLLLHDPERLIRLLTRADRPVQIVVAGKAHPDDAWGKALVQAWAVFVKLPAVRAHAVFLEDYDLALAQRLVAGVDVWLNTPLRPWEACGTSGMKVLVNGGLNVSELDGWWPEAWSPETGWALHGVGDDEKDSSELFQILEEEVVPAFHARDDAGIPRAWTRRMRASMARLTPRFSANRMVRDYVEQLYLPAAAGYRRRAQDGARVGRELVAWRAALDARWGEVHVGNVSVEDGAGETVFTVQVYTGELPPDAIRAELYADGRDGGPPARVAMERDGPLPGAVNACLWRGAVPPGRPASDYTVRVVPHHPDALVPAEERRILWQR